MYKKSIANNSKYLFPFMEGVKYYKSDEIVHTLGTMIVLNDEGDILTCRHVAEKIIINNQLENNYEKLLSELQGNKSVKLKKIEQEHNLNEDTVVLTCVTFPFQIGNNVKIQIKFHEYLDLALIKIDGLKLQIDNYPIFSKSIPLQGQSVCKLGFAFPEYDLYEYSEQNHKIVLKENAISNFPLFPMDGIVTRNIMDEMGNLSMFETSTPGLRGQSGGPIFDPDGLVYGIQTMTKQIDLNFDVIAKVKRGVKNIDVSYTPFLNLGIGISSLEIIKFLKENNVKFKVK